MDTITHAMVGTAISDCWFRKRLGRVATPFAAIMGALPDIDSFTYLISPESAWANHRGITHGFFTMAVAAPLFGYLGYRISRKEGSWGLWTLLAVLCLFSHTILDLVTSWGTMPLLPFSNARISWDVAPVLDIFMTSVSGASLVANRILRWERVDHFINPLAFPVVHRHPKRQKAADWVAKIAVGLAVVYLLLGWHQNRQTVRVARERLAAIGVEAVEVRAMPIMFTYIAWDVAARDADGSVYNAVHSSYAPKTMEFTKFPTLPVGEVEGVLATREGGLFAWYSQGMYVANRVEGNRIRLSDRRFFTLSKPEQSAFSMEFVGEASGKMRYAGTAQGGFRGIDIREELDRLWNLTWSGTPSLSREER